MQLALTKAMALFFVTTIYNDKIYRSAYKSLARPGRKQAIATEDFDFRIAYL